MWKELPRILWRRPRGDVRPRRAFAPAMATVAYAVLFAALSLGALLPFVLCSPLPLADYVNHLARVEIITHIAESPHLARYYDLEWSVLPNLALDVLVPLLASWMPVEQALALFVALSLLLVASGAVAVNIALFGRVSILPFAVFLLLYNRPLLWGLVNYVFSVGLALWLFAAWVALREKGALFRIALFTALSTALFIAHLHGLACYGVLVVAYEAAARWGRASRDPERRTGGLGVAVGQFVVPAILMLGFGETRGRVGDIRFSTPWAKLSGAFDVFNNYDLALDVATAVILGGALLAALLLKRVRVHPRMRLPLLVLIAVYLALPEAMFGSSGADRRLTMFLAVAIVASLEWGHRARRWRAVLGATMLVLFVVRMSVIAVHWSRAADVQEPLVSAIERIGPGDRLAVVVGEIDGEPYLKDPHLDHLGGMAVVRRQAFVNTLFADPGHQILRVPYNADTDFSRWPSQTHRVVGTEASFEKADVFGAFPWDRFDYLLVIHERFFTSPPPGAVERVWNDAAVDSALFRIRP